MEQLVAICVGFLACVLAVTAALYLLARIWLWLLLVAGVIGAIWLLALWLRNRGTRW